MGVGTRYVDPEAGWTRGDDYTLYNNNSFYTVGTGWSIVTNNSSYVNNTYMDTNVLSEYLKFRFYGTAFRFIATRNTTKSNANALYIDGNNYGTWSERGSLQYKMCVLEITGLTLGWHTVWILNGSSDGVKRLSTDCIDITGTGATFGDIRFPALTGISISNVAGTTATATDTLNDLGRGTTITQHGHCWKVGSGPTIANSKTTLGAKSNTDNIVSSITGLTGGTTYFVRSYITNEYGTAYGPQTTFQTAAVQNKFLVQSGDNIYKVSAGAPVLVGTAPVTLAMMNNDGNNDESLFNSTTLASLGTFKILFFKAS